MAANSLVEVDSIDVLDVVDNELDFISYTGKSPNPAVNVFVAGFMMVPSSNIEDPSKFGGARKQMKMSNICCGAHGLSLMLTVTKGETKHTLLFDTGPEEESFEKNVSRLRTDLRAVEHIVLSHYHRDHTGGLPKAIRLINAARPSGQPVTVDVHPERPELRGFTLMGNPVSLEPDPTFEEMSDAGAKLVKEKDGHTALDDTFFISGEIPRVTDYEKGALGGLTLDVNAGKWENDEMIKDERFVVINLKGKGLVLFTGCGHAGVINSVKHAVELFPNIPVYAVVGGFHLASSDEEKIQKTISGFKELGTQILMPGHCTGWKFKNAWDRVQPGGLVPLSVGLKYTL